MCFCGSLQDPRDFSQVILDSAGRVLTESKKFSLKPGCPGGPSRDQLRYVKAATDGGNPDSRRESDSVWLAALGLPRLQWNGYPSLASHPDLRSLDV